MEYGVPLAVMLPLLAIGFAELPWYGNALIALWLWCFGANVGSFMNVVVFRLPAGKSVVSPRSRCPMCDSGIRWFDNVPVISWLWLRARCRNCGVPISSRYPTVEALVALVFVSLAFFSPVTSGDSLPQLLVAPPLRLQTMGSLWLMYAFQLLMFCTLICASLIAYDRNSPPKRLFVPAFFIGLAAPLVWPQLHPVPFSAPLHFGDRWIALLDGCAGIAVGAALALVHLTIAARGEARSPSRWSVIACAAMVGLFLGWQAVACAAVVAEIGRGVMLRLSDLNRWFARIPWAAYLTLTALIYIVSWRTIYEGVPLLGREASMATFALAFFGMAFVSWFTATLAQPDLVPPSQLTLQTSKSNRNNGAPEMPSTDDEQIDAIMNSQSYRLAERDTDFLCRPELRPIRVQLELLKPEMILTEQNVLATIVAFGGTQIVDHQEAEQRLEQARGKHDQDPEDLAVQRELARAERVLAKSKYYDDAREFGRLVSSSCHVDGRCDFAIVTGGGPGIMEAANRGAHDVSAKSIGLNITLPHEQAPNRYITPDLCFQFHYFALRKMHFLFRAKALVAFPGGFGTLDELFDALTLRQTNRMQEIPIILYGKEYWDRVIDFQFLADEGTIRDDDLELIQYAETPSEAWQIICSFHGIEADSPNQS